MLSNALSSKAVALLKEGARDGVVARATHDYLHQYRGGRVSATLDILSVDLTSQTIVVARNSHCPLLLADAQGVRSLPTTSGPIGPYRHTKPEVMEWPLAAGTSVIVYTDGVLMAGRRAGRPLDPASILIEQPDTAASGPWLADRLLAAALAADDARANDDMTVIAITIRRREADDAPLIRRLAVTLPLDSLVAPRR
jgi:serine phosphatase RsbU (regulator of sigma subunit)